MFTEFTTGLVPTMSEDNTHRKQLSDPYPCAAVKDNGTAEQSCSFGHNPQ